MIDKTFLTVSRVNYVSNEAVAKLIYVAAIEASKELPMGQALAEKAAEKVYDKTKEGYSVWTTTYLYKLKWTDSIQSVFYNDLLDRIREILILKRKLRLIKQIYLN